MANKTIATPQKEEVPEKEGPETPPTARRWTCRMLPSKLIRSAKKRGCVTHDQINSVLPSEEVSSEQIEDVLADVVDTEKATADEEQQREEPDEKPESKGGELIEVHQTVPEATPTLRADIVFGRGQNRIRTRGSRLKERLAAAPPRI